MGFGGPNHWRCFGKTTLVARHEGRQLYLQANSDQDKTLWFLYPSPAHTTNHSILSGLLISLSISNTIVLPLFNYCSPVWDSCGVGGKAYLDIKVKEMHSMYYWRSIYRGWGVKINTWLAQPTSMQKLRQMHLTVVHKCLHGIAPLYLLTEFRHMHLFHGYNTRSHDLLRPPFTKTTEYQGSFRINGAWTYNTLPRIIRQLETLSEYTIKLKCYFEQ